MDTELIGIVLLIATAVIAVAGAIWIYFTIYTAFISMSDNIREIDDKFGKFITLMENKK